MQTKHLKWLLVIPVVVLLLSVVLGPLIFSLAISFTKWPKIPIDPIVFAGLYNYVKLAVDSVLINAIWVTIKFIAIAVPLEFFLGLILALALLNINRFRGVICSYLLIPTMLAPVAVGVIWLLLFSVYYGPINYVLARLLSIKPILWTASVKWSLPTIVVADVWQWTPFMMVILLAGLVALPRDIYEAASVDGASSWQVFKHITLPLLKPIILAALIIRTVDALKVFDLPIVMTQGGPGASTETLSLYIYRVAFKFWNLSYAAAISFLFLIMVIAIVTAYLRSMMRS